MPFKRNYILWSELESTVHFSLNKVIFDICEYDLHKCSNLKPKFVVNISKSNFKLLNGTFPVVHIQTES